MSLSAAVLKALVDAGASREQIVAAMSADIAEREAEAAAKLEAKRQNNRERQHRKRERDGNTMSRVTPVTTRDTRDQPPEVSPKDINQTPSSPPVEKTEAKASSKSSAETEKREAIASCLRKAFPAPDGVTDEQWSSFRKQRRKPLNERSYTLLMGKLASLNDAGWPPGDMIDLAIERGWETVFAPRNFDNERSDPTTVALGRVLRAVGTNR